LFDYKDRFYQIEAKALPGQNVSAPHSDVVRFHQSLTFTDGGSNRSEDEVHAIREVCRSLVNPGFGAISLAKGETFALAIAKVRSEIFALSQQLAKVPRGTLAHGRSDQAGRGVCCAAGRGYGPEDRCRSRSIAVAMA
jgi:hypothetical protein